MAQAFQSASKSLLQHAKSVRRTKTFRPRVDIVSPQLCDDALERLAPSFQAYKGCTIIDINPGLGLWSSKLHDVVKPSKHILAEQPASPFAPLLKETLVAQENSPYKLLDWEDKYLWRPDRYVSEGLLPAIEASNSRGPNHSILILANTAMSTLIAWPFKIARSGNPKTHIMLLDWTYDIRRQLGFHARGPVRMLLWCPQKDTTAVLPRTIVYRSKVSLSLELTCHVEEIVGSDETARGKQRKRDQSLELMSERRVFEQMRKSRVTVPAGRETEAYKQVQEEGMRAKDDEVEQNASGTSVPARSWHKELEYLQQRFVAGDFAKAEGMLPGNRGKNTTGARLTPEYARLAELERNIKWVRKKTGATEQLLQEQAEIDALDTQAHNLPQEDPQQQAILQEMEERKERLQRRLDDTRSPQTRDDFEYFKHERKAFDHNPPLLMWDQRRADPLMAYSEEFYPGNGLCLLDIQPEHSPPYPMTTAESDVFSPLISALWQNGKVNVTTLDQIAPGAVDALVPKVPALTDPSRGGERDVRDLPISRLTPEMAYGLTKAWVDWPFKPDLVDLLRKSSHSQEDDSDRRRLRRM